MSLMEVNLTREHAKRYLRVHGAPLPPYMRLTLERCGEDWCAIENYYTIVASADV